MFDDSFTQKTIHIKMATGMVRQARRQQFGGGVRNDVENGVNIGQQFWRHSFLIALKIVTESSDAPFSSHCAMSLLFCVKPNRI